MDPMIWDTFNMCIFICQMNNNSKLINMKFMNYNVIWHVLYWLLPNSEACVTLWTSTSYWTMRTFWFYNVWHILYITTLNLLEILFQFNFLSPLHHKILDYIYSNLIMYTHPHMYSSAMELARFPHLPLNTLSTHCIIIL